MTTNALTVLGQGDLQKGNLGLGSKLFKLQPATIQLTQKMTQGEGVIPGKLRIKETAQYFNEMQVVLLFEPVERRSYFEGEDFSPENQLCFSLDNIQPHPKAKVPQAMYCNGCPKADWTKFRTTGNKLDVPKCKNYWHNMVIDRVTKMPYYLDIKSTSIKPYMAAMQNVARLVAQMQSQGKTPNIFDISFKIYPVSEKGGQYYTFGFKEFAPISDADREEFGSIYLDFANRRVQPQDEIETAQVTQETKEVESSIVESSTEQVDGEYII